MESILTNLTFGLLFSFSIIGLGSIFFKSKIKIIESLAFGSFIFIFILSYLAILLPFGFKFFSWVIYLTGLICFLINYQKFHSAAVVCLAQIKIICQQKINLIYLIIIGVFILKLVFFSLFKPVIDPDVVNYYLPFSRTLFLFDHLPLQSAFSTQAIVHTAIGTLVLPAFTFALSGSSTSEFFRLVNLPFIICLLALIYRFVLKLGQSRTFSLQTLAIMVSLPIVDAFLFEALFYPDFIFIFFCLLFLEKLYLLTNQSQIQLRSVVTLASYLLICLLTKFQALFILPFLGLWLIHSLSISLTLKRIVIFISVTLVMLFRLFHAQTLPAPHPLILFLSPIWLFFLVKPLKNTPSLFYFRPKHVLIFCFMLLFGGLWFYHNFYYFHSLLNRITENDLFYYQLKSEITSDLQTYSITISRPFVTLLERFNLSAVNYSQPPLNLLALFFWPSFGSFWFIFKIIGFLKSRNSQFYFAHLWLVYWFVIWIFFLGAQSDRHLLPILPFISLLIALGIKTICSILVKPALREKVTAIIIVVIALISLIQSRFLSWNLGVALIGRARLKSLSEVAFTSDQNSAVVESVATSLIEKFKLYISALNAPGDFANNYFLFLICASLVISLFLLIFRHQLIKTLKFYTAVNLTLIFALFTLPFVITILLVTEFQPQHFTVIEANKVYSYAGQFESVIPYLKLHTQPQEQIILLGPTTGLPYYLNRPILNFLNSSDVSVIIPVHEIRDRQLLTAFIKNNQFRYLVVSNDISTKREIDFLKQKIPFFKFILDPLNHTTVISPTNSSNWYIYRLY